MRRVFFEELVETGIDSITNALIVVPDLHVVQKDVCTS